MMQEKNLNNNERRIRISGYPPLKNSIQLFVFSTKKINLPWYKKNCFIKIWTGGFLK